MSQDMDELCPHCDRREIVPILYGLPGPETLDAASEGKVIVAGCVVSDEDPLAGCLVCGSQWTPSNDQQTSLLATAFADYFANWSIKLPAGAEAAGARGLIHKAGWTIRYRFDTDASNPYLEFYATHRMTDDRHIKVSARGDIEHLEAIQGMILYDPKEPGSEDKARQRNRMHNNAVVAELEEKGLYPSGDINAFLRVGGGEAIDSLRELEGLLAQAGLPTPPFPAPLRHSLRKIAPWCYSTKDVNPMEMYLFVDRLREALHNTPPDYVAFSHAGHGTNSYALNYELVHRNLILFAQVSWGGVYGDPDEQRRDASDLIDRCNLLLSLVEEHGLDRPLLVAQSRLRGIAICHWLPPGETQGNPLEERNLQVEGEDPFLNARQLILDQDHHS
jgi:hypothetical protein